MKPETKFICKNEYVIFQNKYLMKLFKKSELQKILGNKVKQFFQFILLQMLQQVNVNEIHLVKC